VAVLPRDTTVAELARVPGLSPGVMSAGIGQVPSEQTFLDVSQGNRIDGALYDRELTGLFQFAREVPGWPVVVARADEAPADLVPGLLARRLRAAGITASAEQPMNGPALIAADPHGIVSPLRHGRCGDRCLAVVTAGVGELDELTRHLVGDDLLIAIAAPPPAENNALPIGIAGRGFEGDLTSDSTRTEGYVLSTDVAPTILQRLGIRVPDEMDGELIRTEGSIDPGAVEDLANRMAMIPDRRGPLLITCLAAWIALAITLGALGHARAAAAWVALAFAYLPLVLLAGAAIEPGALVEGILVGVGAAALGALTLRLAPGWRALAISCAISVVAYAIDVIAGSGLTRLSLLGPNPIYGVRFFGIGNELEALVAVMVPVGVGAGLSAYTGRGKPVEEGAAVAAFLGAAFLGAFVFGAGRFGADVGAAIVLPVGAAVAATALIYGRQTTTKSHGRARVAIWSLGAAVVGLILVAFVDLVSGADAHLTRSVLDAGGAGDLADVAQRRLRLSAHGFGQAARNPLFWLLIAGVCACFAMWRRIDAWLRPAPLARAGFIGACAAVAVGVLVNDSGATFLVLGACGLAAALAYAWSQA
jgi:hypothetical protein